MPIFHPNLRAVVQQAMIETPNASPTDVLSAVHKVIPTVSLAAVQYHMRRLGWVSKRNSKVLSIKIAQPHPEPPPITPSYGDDAHAVTIADNYFLRSHPEWNRLRQDIRNAMFVARQRQIVRDAALTIGNNLETTIRAQLA